MVPVKAQEQVIGLLVTVRDKSVPFNPGNQALLEAVADYVSVSLVNARLFQALKEQARSMQNMVKPSVEDDKVKDDTLRNVSQIFQLPLDDIEQQIEFILDGDDQDVDDDQMKALRDLRTNLVDVKRLVATLSQFQKAEA